MGSASVIPPPPPGFTVDAPQPAIPPPPPGFSLDSQQGTPITSTSTIQAQPKPSFMGRVDQGLALVNKLTTDPLGLAKQWSESPTPSANYTEQGQAEHPILAEIGELTSRAKQLMRMVQPEVETLGGAVGAEEPVAEGAGKAAGAVRTAIEGTPKTEAELAEAGNQLLRTTPKDFRNAVVPGRAIVKEAVNPETIESVNNARMAKDTVAERQQMETIKAHLDNSIASLKEQQAVLLKHPTGEGLDLRPIVEESYQNALANAKKVGPDAVKAVNKAHEEMLKVPNDDGELIADRYLNHTGEETAEETNKTKQEFQAKSSYNARGGNLPDTPTQEANKFWKDAAAKIRVQLEDQVPGLGDVNSRIRDASAASKLADKRINTLRGMAPLPSRMNRFLQTAKPALVRGAVTGLGAGAAYDAYRKFLAGE